MARFTTTTTIYYLVALVILIITPFPSSSSIQSVNADGTKSYIVTLKQACDTKSHYAWVEQQQNKKTVRMNTDEAQNADYNSVLRTFSIGKVNGYAATLEESWVKSVLEERSEVQSVQLDESVYVLAPVRKRQDDGKAEGDGKSGDDGKAGDDGDDGKADDGKADDGKADDGKADDGKADDGDNGKSDFIVAKDPLSNIDMMDTTADPLFDNSYTFPKEAGEGVNVFVVDTGVRVTHNEFEGRAKMAKTVCAGCPNTDDNGHGTHVSGIVAGRTFGVAKKANILGIKVLDAKGAGKNSDVIGGLQFVEDEKRANAKEIFVVNMSLGGKQNDAVNDAVKALTDGGVHVMVAAGNEAQDACNTSPASELSAFTVGAVEDDALTITDFSNFGKCVDIFAPGRNIQSCGIANDNDVAVFSGTSQATPHVAGAAALILSKEGDMSPEELAKFMTGNGLENEITFLEGTEDGSPNTFASITGYFS